MSRRVYVAGASSERHERAKPVIAALRAAGFEITHDWTEAVDMVGGGAELTEAQLRACAGADLQGVRSADILVLLAPSPGHTSKGVWVELGAAFGFGVHVFVSGDADFFGRLADRQYLTDGACVAAVIYAFGADERPSPNSDDQLLALILKGAVIR